MRIVFSKDRPAQLDLLLRSLERNAPREDTQVIAAFPSLQYRDGYDLVEIEHPTVIVWREAHGWSFQKLLENALDDSGDTVTFLCDDDVLYRKIDSPAMLLQTASAELLTFSLRLGWETPSEFEVWRWADLAPHDHGYPGSIDGHTFRSADLRRMLDGQTIENPLILETVLNQRCQMLAEERPLMACYREQALVGIDVNSVAEQKGRPHGKVYPQSAAELNERFLAGERISLGTFDHFGPTGCLAEVQFQWEPA